MDKDEYIHSGSEKIYRTGGGANWSIFGPGYRLEKTDEPNVSISANILLRAVELHMLVRDNFDHIDPDILAQFQHSIELTLSYIETRESMKDRTSEFMKALRSKD